jgi:N-acetylmuramoyl-L-alanine amidase
MSKYLYILDNGHGLNTTKKESKVWQDGTQLKEYQFNRNVVKYLSFMLRDAKIDFEILVTELKDIPLKSGRAVRANEFSKNRDSIVISIHANKFPPDDRVNGFETHYFKRSGYESKRGKEIAKIFQKHIGTLGNNRGIKGSQFAILRWPKSPSILTENGYYTNEKECKKLMTSDFQYEIALQHYKAIQEIEAS